MPAFVTHSLMFSPMEKRLRPHSSAAFYWGLQGPDLLFYCKISKTMSTQIRVFKYGCLLHQLPVDQLYMEIMKYLRKTQGKERAVLISYIQGFIAHNSLDYFAHPYVFFKEKQYMRDYAYQEHALAHNKIESDIDALMWQGITGKPIKKFKIVKYNLLDKKEKRYIAKLYVYLIKELLNDKATVDEILPCFTEANFLIKILTNESGLISVISNVAERKLGVKARGAMSAFVRTEKADIRIMNFEKNDWYNLNDKTDIKRDSFLEIYEQAYHAAMHEIKRFTNCYKNNILYFPKEIGSFENGKLDI